MFTILAALLLTGGGDHAGVLKNLEGTWIAVSDRPVDTMSAEAAYLRARLARVNAEIALAQYTDQTFKQAVAIRVGIESATSEQDRYEDELQDLLAWSKGVYVPPGQLAATTAALKRAEREARSAVEQLQTKLAILMEYTSARAIRNLRGEVEKARSEERTKSSLYERAKGAPEAPARSVMGDL